MKKNIILLFCIIVISLSAYQEEVKFTGSWNKHGFSIEKQSDEKLELNYSITKFYFENILIDNENLTNIQLPDVFLPNDEGMPNLPGNGHYIAIPQGSTAALRILNSRTETFYNVEVAPAPRIPLDTDDSPLEYSRNQNIYMKDAFYPV
ncbi:MAG: C25 family peptidase propeptide domain-containing protein, partial [Candidatus Tenebribacter burtonii]|nr:C25 family peptidase propeptide domain-containing protein [Candidatus Tenebribacter burtonii]